MDAVKQVVAANKDYIPPEGKVRRRLSCTVFVHSRVDAPAYATPVQGSLYLRPLLIGTGPILGLAPAPEYTFVIYASPVASYFKARPPRLRSRLPSVSVPHADQAASCDAGRADDPDRLDRRDGVPPRRSWWHWRHEVRGELLAGAEDAAGRQGCRLFGRGLPRCQGEQVH